jgi:hypothetical protein
LIQKYNSRVTNEESKIGCPRKLVLLQDVQRAMGELMDIHNSEVIALLAEDFTMLTDLRNKLQAARKRKAGLIDLYREHVESHGC